MDVTAYDSKGRSWTSRGRASWGRLTATVQAGIPYIKFRMRRRLARGWHIMGAGGPLSLRKAQAALRNAGAADTDLLQRHLIIEHEVAGTPLVAGNAVKVLRDGEETFRAMFAAIRGASDHVNLEYYILEDVTIGGLALSDLLLAKVAEGVAVNVIYDSFGCVNTPAAFFDKLKSGGVKILSYNPVNPLKPQGLFKLNNRDHRKILVADGALAIVGGINLSTTYQSGGTGRTGGQKDGESTDYWRDTDLEIRGPAIAQVQELFVEQWETHGGEPLNKTTFFPQNPEQGTEIVRFIGSTPLHPTPRYYVTLLSALRSAAKTIHITAAYFVPTRQERRALRLAARRGVDVQIVLPGKSDAAIAIAAQRASYSSLLRAGVNIYETTDCILHSKSVVVDGVWSVVGSSNCDHRSVLYNDEVDAVVLGRETATALEATFAEDVSRARRIDRDRWRRRPLTQKLWESIAKIGERLL